MTRIKIMKKKLYIPVSVGEFMESASAIVGDYNTTNIHIAKNGEFIGFLDKTFSAFTESNLSTIFSLN